MKEWTTTKKSRVLVVVPTELYICADEIPMDAMLSSNKFQWKK